MYKVVKANGDSVAVPRLVFAKLGAKGADEARFRVALYLLEQGQAQVADIVRALRIVESQVRDALSFWEGAGLLEQTAEAAEPELPRVVPKREHLTQDEVNAAGVADPKVGFLVTEMQRILGGTLSPKDMIVYATLYQKDELPVEMILLVCKYFVGLGQRQARYHEQVLLNWKREGIADYAAADNHLRKLAKRERRYRDIAALLERQPESLSLAEKKRIDAWHEEFHYSREMLEAARHAAGERAGDILYLHSILKKWNSKGYRTKRDVMAAGENRNLRVQGGKAPKAAKSLMGG